MLLPCRLDDGCLGQVHHLLFYIELCQSVQTRITGRQGSQFLFMEIVHILNVAEPLIDEPQVLVAQCRANSSAAIVTAYNDVLDFQNLHCILQYAEHVQVCVNHQVSNIAVNKYFPRRCVGDFVGWNPAVGTSDPEKFRSLKVRQPGKIFRVLADLFGGPGFVFE